MQKKDKTVSLDTFRKPIGLFEDIINDRRNILMQEVLILQLLLNNYIDLDRDSSGLGFKNRDRQILLNKELNKLAELEKKLEQKISNNMELYSNK